ncbi:MAG TPA: DUF2723 domain-containing protein [Candidatus Limnocylindria bacterium]|nr:DUF2723 domain-containing protein [Candidatus Limnocylindria bacterium]
MMRGYRLLIPIALGAIVLATRLPFVTHLAWEWDSVLYARALEQGFHVGSDLPDQRPHPPGYLFYVAIAAVFRAVLADSNAALVAISVLASAGAAVAVYLLARRFARIELALFAALAFAFDPLVWAHGDIALPYIVLALGSTVLALLFWDGCGGTARQTVVASVALGLASGLRQDLLLLLGPLWLWLVVPRGFRATALGAVAVALASLTWLIPSAALSGGPGAYLGAVIAQSASITGKSSVPALGAEALSYNLRFTILALGWGLLATGVLLLGLLLAPVLHWSRTRRGAPRIGARVQFFLLWLVPGLLLYATWIIGDWGYVLSILPALYVLTAALLERALAGLPAAALLVWRGIAAVLVVGTAFVFVGTSARWSGNALAAHDRSLRDRVTYVRDHFGADRTILLAREDFLIAQYYLPAYRVWLYDPAPAASGAAKVAPGASSLVIFTADLLLRQRLNGQVTELENGERLRSVTLGSGDDPQLFGDGYVVRER